MKMQFIHSFRCNLWSCGVLWRCWCCSCSVQIILFTPSVSAATEVMVLVPFVCFLQDIFEMYQQIFEQNLVGSSATGREQLISFSEDLVKPISEHYKMGYFWTYHPFLWTPKLSWTSWIPRLSLTMCILMQIWRHFKNFLMLLLKYLF